MVEKLQPKVLASKWPQIAHQICERKLKATINHFWQNIKISQESNKLIKEKEKEMDKNEEFIAFCCRDGQEMFLKAGDKKNWGIFFKN